VIRTKWPATPLLTRKNNAVIIKSVDVTASQD
jgi:hypothetical protein